MAKMKQLMLDIIESHEPDEESDSYSFPNHPIIPTKPAIFDDSEYAEVSSD